VSGDGEGITAYAVFVSKDAGETLLSLKGAVYILPESKWAKNNIKLLIVTVSLVVVFIVGTLLTCLCCIRAHILAEARKELETEELNRALLHDDNYILSTLLIPHQLFLMSVLNLWSNFVVFYRRY
jgi:hypothetical protein